MKAGMRCILAAAITLILAVSTVPCRADPSIYTSTFRYPTLQPGRGADGHATVVDQHCAGNGRSVVCESANTTAGSVSLFVRRADAQGSFADPMTISLTTLTLIPNPFTLASKRGAAIAAYQQSLDMTTATITITAGGAGTPSDYALQLSIWVTTCAAFDDPQQPCDTVLVSGRTSSGYNTSFALQVTAASVRPDTTHTYPINYNCYEASSSPDVFPDPLPPPFPPAATPPTSTTTAAPAAAASNGSTIVQYHRNLPTDVSIITTHMKQQAIENLTMYVPDMWTNRTFGVAITGNSSSSSSSSSSGASMPLVRTSPATLATAAPATAFDLRLVLHSNQTDDEDTFLSQLAGRVAAADPSYDDHLAWWAAFWNRSSVHIYAPTNTTGNTTASRKRAQPSGVAAPAPPTAGLALWLAADALALPDGAAVAQWPDASGNGYHATQPNVSAQPVYIAASSSPNALPAVRFDGVSSYLSNSALSLSPVNTTVLAVFTDFGSATTCCSGVFYAVDSCRGISTTLTPDTGAHVLLTDWCYSLDPHGSVDVTARPVVAAVRYTQHPQYPANSTSVSFLNGCLQTSNSILPGAGSSGFMVGSRAATLERYFLGDISELLVYNSSLSDADLQAATDYLTAKWQVAPLDGYECTAEDVGGMISMKYAAQRFANAVQSRGSRVPIRFNGQLFMANLPPHVDDRTWGVLDCWQNTRLPYVSMLANGDSDLHAVLLDYMSDRLPLQRARTQQFFGHDGIHWTECKVPVGVPSSVHYDGSCTDSPQSRPPGLPYYEVCVSSGNRFEFGGDGGTPEIGLAALEHYYYTLDAAALQSYAPLAELAATFYQYHYPIDGNGQVRIAPTGVLEYYWCWTNGSAPGQPTDCCENDLPTVAGLTKLLDMLLAVVPLNATSPAQRNAWQALRAIVPPLPLQPDPAHPGSYLLAPAEVMCTAGSNPVEAPGMYAVHPYRLLTVGRAAVDASVNLSIAQASFHADPHASSSDDNHDWCQGVFDAALLGLADDAVRLVVDRALQPPAPGYRWPGFAPAIYDYAPVSELYAGLMSSINWMLLQPADDAAGTMVLFPAWPCDWDVDFTLWGPLNTTVSVSYVNGSLVSLDVQPASRKSAIIAANCVQL